MTRSSLIEENKLLFWYFDKTQLNVMSDSVLVEFILNYGTIQDVKALFEVLGKENVAREFGSKIKNERNNYFPMVRNFFDLYFRKNVPKYPF